MPLNSSRSWRTISSGDWRIDQQPILHPAQEDIRPEARTAVLWGNDNDNEQPLLARAALRAASAARSAVLGGLLRLSLPDTDRVFLSAAGGWDRNRDGVVTCDEWKAYATELFNAADANHDGSLDRTEYAKIVSTDRMFQTVEFGYYDANGDGKVERTEFVDKPNRAFALLDKNNQCKLTATRPPARAPIQRAGLRFQRRRNQAIRARSKRAARASAGCDVSFIWPDIGPSSQALAKLRPLATHIFYGDTRIRPRGTPELRPALGAQYQTKRGYSP